MTGLDRSRRYLRPMAQDGAAETHLSVYGWEGRLDGWAAWSTSLCGRSVHDARLDLDAPVTCAKCQRAREGYEAVFAKEDHAFPVAERVAARKDARYPVVLEEIRAFGWPAGNPMVPDSYADTLATRVMTAIRAHEHSEA